MAKAIYFYKFTCAFLDSNVNTPFIEFGYSPWGALVHARTAQSVIFQEEVCAALNANGDASFVKLGDRTGGAFLDSGMA